TASPSLRTSAATSGAARGDAAKRGPHARCRVLARHGANPSGDRHGLRPRRGRHGAALRRWPLVPTLDPNVRILSITRRYRRDDEHSFIAKNRDTSAPIGLAEIAPAVA